jgi:hypothetical protein
VWVLCVSSMVLGFQFKVGVSESLGVGSKFLVVGEL